MTTHLSSLRYRATSREKQSRLLQSPRQTRLPRSDKIRMVIANVSEAISLILAKIASSPLLLAMTANKTASSPLLLAMTAKGSQTRKS